MEDAEYAQLSIEDDEIVWTQASNDFILIHHPLLDAHSLPSTVSDLDGDPSFALENLSLCDHDTSTSAESDGCAPSPNEVHADDPNRDFTRSSDSTSTCSEYYSGASTPTASYEDASAFVSRFISSPVKGDGAELNLLRALIIELGIRSPRALDLPSTLTAARKVLKAEAHVNIKEYVYTSQGPIGSS